MRDICSAMFLMILSSIGLVCGQDQMQAQIPKSAKIASYPNLEVQAKEYGEAFVQDDIERLVQLTYPRYIELIGGRQRLTTMVRATRRQIEPDGMQLLSWAPTDVTQLLEESDSLYAVVPMAMRTKSRGYAFEDYDCLIAVSTDRGEHWTFVSSSCVNLKVAFPRVADKLILCPEKPPTRLVQP